MIHGKQETSSTVIIEERAMVRGRKNEIGPCRDGGQYRDISIGEIRTWNATTKPFGRPASAKTLASRRADMAPAVELSPQDVLPTAICIDMDEAVDVQAPIANPSAIFERTSERNIEIRADWVADGVDCFSGLEITTTNTRTGVTTTTRRARYQWMYSLVACTMFCNVVFVICICSHSSSVPIQSVPILSVPKF
jgi:hypothetical protein